MLALPPGSSLLGCLGSAIMADVHRVLTICQVLLAFVWMLFLKAGSGCTSCGWSGDETEGGQGMKPRAGTVD